MSDIPDHMKGRIVPSTVQLYGETFHRERNLDEHFCDISKAKEAAEAEVARLKEANGRYAGAIASLTDDHGKLLAQCNALRSALEGIRPHAEEMVLDIAADIQEGGSGSGLKEWNAVLSALAQTPKQSLEAYKDEVLEEAAKVAEKRYEEWRKSEQNYSAVADDTSICEDIANNIRALKGPNND